MSLKTNEQNFYAFKNEIVKKLFKSGQKESIFTLNINYLILHEC